MTKGVLLHVHYGAAVNMYNFLMHLKENNLTFMMIFTIYIINNKCMTNKQNTKHDRHVGFYTFAHLKRRVLNVL